MKELRSEFVEELLRIDKEKGIEFKNILEFTNKNLFIVLSFY
tara:strand:+ start:715 stop:840 length:126 start_codon:yes stop_codon:yes gene_type:complete